MKFFTLVFSLFLFIETQSQQIIPCYSREIQDANEKRYSWYKRAVDDAFNEAKFHALESRKSDAFTDDSIYTINVVFHVLWNVAKENIHDSILKRQIEILNRDFGRRNADTTKTKFVFRSRASAAGIQFKLATVDPKGDSTSGILRIQTDKKGFVVNLPGGFYSDSMKYTSKGGSNAWNNNKYLNIWVCRTKNKITNGMGQEEDKDDQILGFAFPPANMPNWAPNSSAESPELDGMILHYKVVGDNNPNFIHSTLKSGRTAVHEAGHYLGLRHIWGDGIDDCADSDGIDDTPDAKNKQQQTCDSLNTCTEATNPQLPDMSENYMDYTSELCTNMFSKGQVDLMRGVMKTKRKLLYSYGLSVENALHNPTMNLYPNPVSSELHVEFDLMEQVKCEIAIFNQLGEKVMSREVNHRFIDEKLNVESLPISFYTIKIISANNKVYSSKFIKLD